VYVPAPAYDTGGAQVLRSDGGRPYAPAAYQLYSRGADGRAGDAAANADNITSWDREKAWRSVYRQRHRARTRRDEEES
jgi:hypothetical protein